MEMFADAEVDLQRTVTRSSEKSTEIYQTSLGAAVDAIMDSRHDDARFCFCEGLLDGLPSARDLCGLLRDARELPFVEAGRDWFGSFPPLARPSDCVVLAGAGARSTFHRDPYEWTGTSLCLEGSKVWRFVAPPPRSAGGVGAVDSWLRSYRLPSAAWEDGGATLSAGWQSDTSLYGIRAGVVPSARDFGEWGEDDPERRLAELERVAADAEDLAPDFRGLDGPDVRQSVVDGMHCAVQYAGDLMIIPAHWWHQTYGLEPSLAVASQRCGGERDAERVLRHMLETALSGEGQGGRWQEQVPKGILGNDFSLYNEDDVEDLLSSLFGFLGKVN